MTTKTDWEVAMEQYMAAEGEKLGGPPSAEEVIAYTRGELPEEEAERIRTLLVYYPGLAPVLAEQEPELVHGILTPEELAHDRAAIAARLVSPFTQRRRLTSTHYLALAASVLLVITAVLGVQVRRLQRELNQPHAVARYALHAKGDLRSPHAPPRNVVPAGQRNAVLALPLDEGSAFPRYRVDLLQGDATLWSDADLRSHGDSLELSMPLPAGDYRLELYGMDGSQAQPLASYDLRVTTAAQP